MTIYVPFFNCTQFRTFVNDAVGLDISDDKYRSIGSSKANRLRGFWDVEPVKIVGQLLYELVMQVKNTTQKMSEHALPDPSLIDDCLRIAATLKGDSIVDEIEAIQATNDDKDFESLARAIRESIEKNVPEQALDRLHTYMMKLVRSLCQKHAIPFNREESLNAIFGKYLRHLRSQNMIESDMAEKILSFSVMVLQAFNDIRNNRSFAHDNQVLNYNESLLIFNNVTNMVRFVNKIEDKFHKSTEQEEATDWDDLPF